MELTEETRKQVKEILQSHYDNYDEDKIGVYEGDATYYIQVKIPADYVDATLIEEFEKIGLTINSFSSLNGKYGQLMSFSLKER